MRYVVIGSCIAAMGAVEGIRSIAQKGSITIIDGEQRGPYTRPLISYFLARPYKFKDISYRSPEFLAANGVEVIKAMAGHINRISQQVVLDNGQTVPYDRLLIAAGGSPVIPAIEGVEAPWVKTFYTLADAESLHALLAEGQNAVIIGSGLIGMKAAEALWQRGLKVNIIEKEAHILPRIMSPDSAAIISTLLNGAGIKLRCNEELTAIRSDHQIEFASGLCLHADLLILALGTRPRTELAAECGLKVNKGIVVDNYLRTNDENIFAAGDVIESKNVLTGENEIMALLPQAHKEGYLAGCNMAGHNLADAGGIFQNSVNIMDSSICSAGSLINAKSETLIWQQDDKYLELFLNGSYLSKYIAINLPEVTGPLTNTIEKQVMIAPDGWQEFIAAPSLSTIPSAYWHKIGGIPRANTWNH
ncbi:MAG: FAD-dependent oxidoreductase [Syntrophomonadaceae bacterium]|nr:FAD-dependent oxidoreductase [Syntrophomonadaceae bacterium]MDD3023286.1 FAD-dependent oxidoreductase [Syntrophomonadaceae bacterium]